MSQEKVIVINDMDGHTTVLQWSKENLRKVLEAFYKSGKDPMDDSWDRNPEEFLSEDPSADDIDTYLLEFGDVNFRNSPCHILEPVDWPFGESNPFA